LKAITVHQPYAHLIVTPEAELPIGAVPKRVENRRWATSHRGPLLVHAGKSLNWLNEEDYPCPSGHTLTYDDFPEMAFGAIIGQVDLIDCVELKSLDLNHWVRRHFHSSGPFCWILENATRFDRPISWRGQQGLFDVDHLDDFIPPEKQDG
jgi:activating signal cointegrator 1